jgi:hypothetical protein
MINVYHRLAPAVSNVTKTNCMLPAYTNRLIKKAHQNPYPASFSINPKANPRKRYPNITGTDCTIA